VFEVKEDNRNEEDRFVDVNNENFEVNKTEEESFRFENDFKVNKTEEESFRFDNDFKMNNMNDENYVNENVTYLGDIETKDPKLFVIDDENDIAPDDVGFEITYSESTKSYECPQCPYTAEYKSKVELHVNTVHRKVNAVACPECSKEYANKYHMKIHIELVMNSVNMNFHMIFIGILFRALGTSYCIDLSMHGVHVKFNLALILCCIWALRALIRLGRF
jgi:hypothetical protein